MLIERHTAVQMSTAIHAAIIHARVHAKVTSTRCNTSSVGHAMRIQSCLSCLCGVCAWTEQRKPSRGQLLLFPPCNQNYKPRKFITHALCGTLVCALHGKPKITYASVGEKSKRDFICFVSQLSPTLEAKLRTVAKLCRFNLATNRLDTPELASMGLKMNHRRIKVKKVFLGSLQQVRRACRHTL